MHGYDYGILPTIMALGDTGFMEVWEESEYNANAYGVWPEYGIIFNAPFVCMIFDNEEKGRELFEHHFCRWARDSNDGDAVGLTFIEWNDNSYTMIVYPEMDHLTNRMFPDEVARKELNIISIIPSRGKEFPQKSEFFEQFKTMAQSNAVLFMGGTAAEPFEDLIIRKLKVEFVQEDHIQENSMAYSYVKGRGKEGYSEETPPPLEPENEIFDRRIRNLDKYFPVTLERVRVSCQFQETSETLVASGYQSWQILQAMCNLVLSHNAFGTVHFQEPNTGTDGRPVQIHEILQNHYFEKPSMSEIPDHLMKPAILRRQIKLDSIELLKARRISLPKKVKPKYIQKTLHKHGLFSPIQNNSNDYGKA